MSTMRMSIMVILAGMGVARGGPAAVKVQLGPDTPLKNAAFHVYDPPFKAKAVYSSFEDARTSTPEELAQSIYSAVTQEWVNWNERDGKGLALSDEQIETRKNRDKDRNYFLLAHRITFAFEGEDYCVVKFHFVDEGKVGARSALMAVHADGRWRRTAHPALSELNTVMTLDTAVMEKLLGLRKLEPSDPHFLRELTDTLRKADTGLKVGALYDHILELKKRKEYDKMKYLYGIR